MPHPLRWSPEGFKVPGQSAGVAESGPRPGQDENEQEDKNNNVKYNKMSPRWVAGGAAGGLRLQIPTGFGCVPLGIKAAPATNDDRRGIQREVRRGRGVTRSVAPG